MGVCLSTSGTAALIEKTDGNVDDFHKRYIEDVVLGEGEFGVVRKVFDMKSSQQIPYACKYLKKGMQFKDNTLYAPVKKEIIIGEVEILQTLQANSYCLQLVSVYESPKKLFIVTEMCEGGDVTEWVSHQPEDLRTEDVSRVAYQLLSAIGHCAKHDIIHRDIKGENVMFKHQGPGSDLRLIDFGSGTNRPANNKEGEDPLLHNTFAGTAFYISPEMFQKTYTTKTDVWSVGVTLYVLVAGYPADCLQRAFNVLQKNQNRNLRQLPNLPENMPDSYYDMLERLLVYRHKARISAQDALDLEFVQFHLTRDEEDSTEDETDVANDEQLSPSSSSSPTKRRKRKFARTPSVLFEGSVQHHKRTLDYQKFERSLTTLLATMLSKTQFEQLIQILNHRYRSKDQPPSSQDTAVRTDPTKDKDSSTQSTAETECSTSNHSASLNGTKLGVVPIYELKQIIDNEIQNMEVLGMIYSLNDSEHYNSYAYHIALLLEFSSMTRRQNRERANSRDRKSFTGGSIKLPFFDASNSGVDVDSSVRSSCSAFSSYSCKSESRISKSPFQRVSNKFVGNRAGDLIV